MTTLVFEKKRILGIPLGEASRFPALRDPIKSTIDSRLNEDDELFINYGMYSDSLPYTMLDDYDLAEKQELEFDSAVLENEHLRAELVISLGGRLWSLYDKDAKRDLLTNNTEFLPCNLGIRNAWFAGGAEFNCGRRGHDANTCRPRFAAELHDPELGPVLRIYDYSRDRRTPFQIDFFLPEDSRFLFARGRIYNPHAEVVPMYWWSNIALPMTPGCRVVVPAMETYVNKYDAGSHFITKIPMPDGEGFDQTYPENFRFVRDHFYDIPHNSRKWEALFNRDGSGFIHMSTRRLQGRKLFVWGKTTGGDHWQKKLLGPGVCDYLELQAGLAKSQQECLPMPPKTAWEWLEAYGGIQANADGIFGSWEHAVETVTGLADQILPEQKLEELLKMTHDRIALRSGRLHCSGNRAAALEEMQSGTRIAPQLDFCHPGEKEAEWMQLLNDRKLDDDPPRSFQADPVWLEPLLQAPDGWKKHYHLTLQYFRLQDWERAAFHAETSFKLKRNAWTLHLLGNVLLRAEKEKPRALKLLAQAALEPEADAYLVKETLKLLALHQAYPDVISVFESLSSEHRNRPSARLQYAKALANTGKTKQAHEILLENGGLELPDAREGEADITKLYLELLGQAGIPGMEIPLALDYRTK